MARRALRWTIVAVQDTTVLGDRGAGLRRCSDVNLQTPSPRERRLRRVGVLGAGEGMGPLSQRREGTERMARSNDAHAVVHGPRARRGYGKIEVRPRRRRGRGAVDQSLRIRCA